MFWLTFINGRQQHDTDLCQYITMCVLLIHYFMPGGPVQYSVHLGQSFWFAGCCSSTISLSEETLRFRAYMFSILSSYSRDYPRSLNNLYSWISPQLLPQCMTNFVHCTFFSMRRHEFRIPAEAIRLYSVKA